jgi:hypothetical protein
MSGEHMSKESYIERIKECQAILRKISDSKVLGDGTKQTWACGITASGLLSDLLYEVVCANEERENPQPLTLEQLRERIGKPVWIRGLVVKNDVECLRLDRFEAAYYHSGDDARFIQFGTDIGIIRWCCKYGRTWLAYDYEVKEGGKDG